MIILALALSIAALAGCHSYRTAISDEPKVTCASDPTGACTLCDLTLILTPRGTWLKPNGLRIEKYFCTNPAKTEFRIVLSFHASAYPYYEKAVIVTDEATKEFVAPLVKREALAGELLRESHHFVVTKEVIAAMAAAGKVRFRMVGRAVHTYAITTDDMEYLRTFNLSL